MRAANPTRTENPHSPPPDWQCYSADALAGAGIAEIVRNPLVASDIAAVLDRCLARQSSRVLS